MFDFYFGIESCKTYKRNFFSTISWSM